MTDKYNIVWWWDMFWIYLRIQSTTSDIIYHSPVINAISQGTLSTTY